MEASIENESKEDQKRGGIELKRREMSISRETRRKGRERGRTVNKGTLLETAPGADDHSAADVAVAGGGDGVAAGVAVAAEEGRLESKGRGKQIRGRN